MNMQPVAARDDLLRQPWWAYPTGQASGALMATAGYLAGKLQTSHEALWRYYQIYSREDARQMGIPSMRTRVDDMRGPAGLALNVVKAVVQTIQAQTIRGKVRPMFLTSGADWAKQRQIKRVDAFAQGAMYHAQVDRLAPELSLHALVAGTGIGKVTCGEDGRPALDVVLPQELLYDPIDGARRNPRCLYHVRPVARDALLEHPAFAGKADLLKGAGNPELSPACSAWRDALVDQVTVVEAWRLPSSPDADNGRHIIALDNGTLVDEPWCQAAHPFVFLRWDQRVAGFLGVGIAQDLRAVQLEINRLLLCIQEQMLRAGPKVFVARGSGVNPADLAVGRIWDIIEYTGQEPKMAVFATVAPEMFAQVDRLYQRAFDITGVSQQSSRGEKPAGVTSGVAIQTTTDLQTGRLVGYSQAYESLHVDIATAFLDTAMAWCEGGGESDVRDVSFTYPATGRGGRQYLGQVSAKEIKLARDEYVCEVWPTSKLAQAPGARLEQIGLLLDKQMLSPPEGRQLLDFPDLQRANSLAYAPLDAVSEAIDDMLEDGEPRLPAPWTDLSIAVPMAARALQRAQVDGAPESRWQLVAAYLEACHAQQQAQAAAQAPSPGAAAPADPPMPPGPNAGPMPQ